MAPPTAPAVPPTPLAALQVRDLSKVYGQGPSAVHALDGISLEVQAGELLCLVGASGCGKSTLLNLIADLDTPSAGTIDRRGTGRPHVPGGGPVPVAHRAGEHRAGPAAARRAADASGPQEADQLLHTVHLDGFGDKRPHELSGGMRQRVAIARAFAQEADILLMDEPFGALDAMTRDLLHAELERLWADRNLSVVFVTHNVREAARLADRVVLLSSRPGRVVSEFDGRHRTPPAHGLPRGVEPRRRDHRRAADRRCAAMPTSDVDRAATPSSTRSWPASTPSSWPQRGGRPLARRLWSAAWPKLAAIAIALALWEAGGGERVAPEFVLPPPEKVWDALKEQAESGTLWTAIAHHACAEPPSASRWRW